MEHSYHTSHSESNMPISSVSDQRSDRSPRKAHMELKEGRRIRCSLSTWSWSIDIWLTWKLQKGLGGYLYVRCSYHDSGRHINTWTGFPPSTTHRARHAQLFEARNGWVYKQVSTSIFLKDINIQCTQEDVKQICKLFIKNGWGNSENSKCVMNCGSKLWQLLVLNFDNIEESTSLQRGAINESTFTFNIIYFIENYPLIS